jgi:hypothetical protein
VRETIELRIPEENAAKYLPPGIGADLGRTPPGGVGMGAQYGVRKVTIGTSEPLFAEIGRIHREFRARGEYFFYGWSYHRNYSVSELEAAELLNIFPGRTFEPAGEECGTKYDDSQGCPVCGAGAPQTGPLFLDGRTIPKAPDFSRTIAGELVVSSRVAGLFHKKAFRGGQFDPVRLANKRGAASDDYFQLQIAGPHVELDPVTRVGSGPFDNDAFGRCPRGDVVGLNVMSELTVRRSSLGGADLSATAQMVGARSGLLRPRRFLLLSPRAWRAFREAGAKGLVVEIAHVV